MLKISFEINGRPVAPGSLGDAFQEAMLEGVRDMIVERLSSVRCPVHGQGPHVIATGRSAGELTFSVQGCCQQLIDDTVAALN